MAPRPLVGAGGILGASQNLSTFDAQGQHFLSVSMALSGGEGMASRCVPRREWAVSAPFPNAPDHAGTSISACSEIPENSL